jgi:hypothetical protein
MPKPSKAMISLANKLLSLRILLCQTSLSLCEDAFTGRCYEALFDRRPSNLCWVSLSSNGAIGSLRSVGLCAVSDAIGANQSALSLHVTRETDHL